MTHEDKVFQLEIQVARLEWEIKGKLDNIEKLLISERGNRDNVITQSEQIKTIQKDNEKLKEDMADLHKQINSINLKIAMVSGAWAVIMFIINKL